MVELCLEPFSGLQSLFQFIWKGELKNQIFYLTAEERAGMEGLYAAFDRKLQFAREMNKIEELKLFVISFFKRLQGWIIRTENNEKNPIEPRDSRLVEYMMTWIESHFHNDITLKGLTKSLYVSPHYASHLFRKETGTTIQQYVMIRRLQLSCLLLTTTNYAISSIGEQVGFKDSAYFCRCFKNKWGMSPLMYRRAMK
jgi:YesN/AraC family two-component response regulator